MLLCNQIQNGWADLFLGNFLLSLGLSESCIDCGGSFAHEGGGQHRCGSLQRHFQSNNTTRPWKFIFTSMSNEEVRRRLRERHAHRFKPTKLREEEIEDQYSQFLIESQQRTRESSVSRGPKLQQLGSKSASGNDAERNALVEEMLNFTASTNESGNEDNNPATEYNLPRSGVPITNKSMKHSLNRTQNLSLSHQRVDPSAIASEKSHESFSKGNILRNQAFLYEYDVGIPPIPHQLSMNSIERDSFSFDLNNSGGQLVNANQKFGIPLGSMPNESLDISMIDQVQVGDTSRVMERTFDLDDDMPDDERNASALKAQNDDNHHGENDYDSSKEYLMVSRNYVEVCLPSSYDATVEKSLKQEEKPETDANSSKDLFDELRSGDFPRIVRKFHEELDEIKTDFMCLGEEITDAATEMRHKGQSFLTDVFVSR